jgi:predicted small secreted protein
MTRKLFIIIAAMLLIAMVATACSTGNGSASGDVKLGLGTINRINRSADAGESDGNAQTDAVIAAVLVDDEGKIVDVTIDTVQSKIAFTADGKIATDPETLVKTKKELGDEYGMKDVSSLNKEWYEQIEALEEWLVGKTLSDIENIKLTDGKADDLKTSVTITVTAYLGAVKKAIENAD